MTDDDPRIVALARARVGSGLYAARGSMADDLGRLAAGVIVQDMHIRNLWVVVKTARDFIMAACSFPESRCGVGQHSVDCDWWRAYEALARAVDDCPATQTIEAMAQRHDDWAAEEKCEDRLCEPEVEEMAVLQAPLCRDCRSAQKGGWQVKCSICGADVYPDGVCPECSLTAQLTRALKQHALDRAEIERLEKLRAEMQGVLVKLRNVYKAARVVASKNMPCACLVCAEARARLRQAVVDTALAEKESDRE